MKIEIWSDVVCPWCYIGKRRLESALSRFGHADEVEVVWRSFELNPDAPREELGTLEEMLAAKYGMTLEQAAASNARITKLAAEEGLEYRLDRAKRGNSFDAHRLIHLAASRGLQGAMKERLMRAYFTEGEAIAEPEVLARLGRVVGIDESEARRVLEGSDFAEEVREDEATAQSLGITGVPFFVIEGKWGISGAQPAELFSEALDTAWDELHPTAKLS